MNGKVICQLLIDQDLSFHDYRWPIELLNLENQKYQSISQHHKFYEKARAALLDKLQLAGKLQVQTSCDRRYLYMRCREEILCKKYPNRNSSTTLIKKQKNLKRQSTPYERIAQRTPSTPSDLGKHSSASALIHSPSSTVEGPQEQLSDGGGGGEGVIITSKELMLHKRAFSERLLPTTNVSTPTTPTTQIPPSPIVSTVKNDVNLVDYYQFAGMQCLFTHHRRAVTRVKFGRQSRNLIAFASVDHTLTVSTDVLESSQPSFFIFQGHKRGISDFDWSMTNDFILSCSIDKSLCIWDVKTRKCARTINTTSAVFCCAFHPINNNILVAGTANSVVEFYNFSTGKEICNVRIESPAKSLCFSQCGGWLFTGCADGKIRWLNCTNRGLFTSYKFEGSAQAVNKGRAINSLSYREYHTSECKAVPTLLMNAVDSTVRMFQINPLAEDQQQCLLPWAVCPIVNMSFTVRSSFSPLLDNRKDSCFASGSEDGTVYIFDYPVEPPESGLAKSRNVNKLQGHYHPVLDVAWNDDESLLASCDSGGTVIVWKRIKDITTTLYGKGIKITPKADV